MSLKTVVKNQKKGMSQVMNSDLKSAKGTKKGGK